MKIMNNCSNNNITVNTDKVKSPAESTPVIPELPGLRGLKAGPKQHWIVNNLKLIETLYDNFGFEATRVACCMKAETLEKALKKAERADRPAIKKADQAFNSAFLANEKLYKLIPEVETIGEALLQHFDSDLEFRNQLSNYFQLLASANSIMADAIRNRASVMVNLTEHI